MKPLCLYGGFKQLIVCIVDLHRLFYCRLIEHVCIADLYNILACLVDSLQMCICMEVSYKLPFVSFGQQVCFCCELTHICLYCRLMKPVYIMYTHTACLFVLQTVITCLWLLWAHTSCPLVLETHTTFLYFKVIQYHICILDTYNMNACTMNSYSASAFQNNLTGLFISPAHKICLFVLRTYTTCMFVLWTHIHVSLCYRLIPMSVIEGSYNISACMLDSYNMFVLLTHSICLFVLWTHETCVFALWTHSYDVSIYIVDT